MILGNASATMREWAHLARRLIKNVHTLGIERNQNHMLGLLTELRAKK